MSSESPTHPHPGAGVSLMIGGRVWLSWRDVRAYAARLPTHSFLVQWGSSGRPRGKPLQVVRSLPMFSQGTDSWFQSRHRPTSPPIHRRKIFSPTNLQIWRERALLPQPLNLHEISNTFLISFSFRMITFEHCASFFLLSISSDGQELLQRLRQCWYSFVNAPASCQLYWRRSYFITGWREGTWDSISALFAQKGVTALSVEAFPWDISILSWASDWRSFCKLHPPRSFERRHFPLRPVHVNGAGKAVSECWGLQSVISTLEAASEPRWRRPACSLGAQLSQPTQGEAVNPFSPLEPPPTQPHPPRSALSQSHWPIFLTTWPESSGPLPVLLELSESCETVAELTAVTDSTIYFNN